MSSMHIKQNPPRKDVTMIRKIVKDDRAIYKKLVKEFYASPAVLHSIPDQHIDDTFIELIRSDEYLEGYMIEWEGEAAGYALLTKSYSQEAGGKVVWLDEFYVRNKFRGKGLGKSFLDFFIEKFGKCAARLRLEIEPENIRASALYSAYGFKPLEYRQMYAELEAVSNPNEGAF